MNISFSATKEQFRARRKHVKEIHATLTEHDEKIRQAAINGVLDQVRKELRKEYSAVCGGVDWDSIEAVLIRLRQQSGTAKEAK